MLADEPNNKNLLDLRDQLTNAIQQLQVSRNKLTTSKEALSRLSSTPEGTSMLVPITSSLRSAERDVGIECRNWGALCV